jgi:uncharacterized protein
MRAVLDANVFVSAVLTPGGPPGQVIRALADGRFDLIISQPIIRDVVDVLARPRVARRYRVPAERIQDIVTLMRERGELVSLTGNLRICRDPDDDLVLETALTGRAQALVSRDADVTRDPVLIAALRERGVAILTVQHFLTALEAEASERT